MMSNVENTKKQEIDITIDDKKCISCGKCIEVCPLGILTYKADSKLKTPIVFDSKACICCGHCISVCPKDAIIHNQLSLSDFPPIDSFHSIEWSDFIKFTRQRRSIRNYLNKPVPKELIDKILKESTRYAPTGHNRQKTKILYYEGEYLKKIRNELNKTIIRLCNFLNLFHCFSKNLESHWRYIRSCKHMIKLGMDPSTRNAPLVLFFTADKKIKESEVDAALLSYQTLISAELLGLKSCYFGALINSLPYSRKLRTLITLPPHQKVVCGLLLGYSNIKYNRYLHRKKIEIINKE
jgi:nitroreductase/NAD-dependent dihydropyrimidine dehydrogenase PreA subunit